MTIVFDNNFLWKLYALFVWPLGLWLVFDFFIWPIYGGSFRPSYWFFLAMSFVVILTEVRFSPPMMEEELENEHDEV